VPLTLPSRTVDLAPVVHYLDYDGPDGPPPLVCVHGLGGSHAEWAGFAVRMAARSRVLVPDLAGFGRTPPGDDPADVEGNRRLLDRFLDRVAGRPVVVAGSSMGGLIAMREAMEAPDRLAGLVLVDPSLPRPRFGRVDPLVGGQAAAAALTRLACVGEELLRLRRERLGPDAIVDMALRITTVDPAAVDPETVDAMRRVARERPEVDRLDAAYVEAGLSLLQAHAGRRSLDVVRAVPALPTLLLHGRQDRLVPVGSARQAAALRPDWTFHELQGVGHLPALEQPERVAALVGAWLARRVDRPAG